MKLELYINGKRDARTLTFDSLAVENGSMVVRAKVESDTTPTPTPPPPTPEPEPTPQPEPPKTGCGPVPRNVKIHKTSEPGVYFSTTISSNRTSEGDIHAFEFNSGNGKGRVVATRVSGGEGKLVIISKCPGDIDNPAPGKSKDYSSESTSVYFTTNKDGPTRGLCVLEPNTIYYANVVNATSFYGDPPACNGSCGFYFVKD